MAAKYPTPTPSDNKDPMIKDTSPSGAPDGMNLILNMSVSEINSLNKPKMAEYFKTLVNAYKTQPPAEDQSGINDTLKQLERTNTENFAKLNEKLDNMPNTIKEEIRGEFENKFVSIEKENQDLRLMVGQQQTFLEQVDANQRASNIILLGLSEDDDLIDGDEVAESDMEKARLTLDKIGSDADIQDVQRLGAEPTAADHPQRPRPLKIKLVRASERPEIIENAPQLRALPVPFRNLIIKKDTHPLVRKEWARLHQVANDEKAKPGNIGHTITIDFKAREVKRDGITIDNFKNPFA